MSKKQYVSTGLIDIGSISKEQERDIFTAIRSGDEQLKERLIKSGMTQVSEVAANCVSSEASFEELFTEAANAFVEAINTFDCFTDERFITYLSRCLEERMQYCYAHLPRFLPIDYRVIQLHDRYEVALLELYPNSPDREYFKVHHEGYLADYLGVTLEELRTMKNEYSMCRIISLSESVKLDKSLPDDYEDDDIDNKSPLLELIVDPASENGAAEYLDDLMDCLSDDERYVVCAREGVLSSMERTDEQIASTLGIEMNKVEVLYQDAINKIRKAGTRMD